MLLTGIPEKREELANFLDFRVALDTPPFAIRKSEPERGYTRLQISYLGDERDDIPAYLLLPDGAGPFPAVLVHHQHHGQRHLGKSEVCGLAGDPLQAFGPTLAARGIAVLAPDSICFEDRRRNVTGTLPDDDDVAQHYDEMCYRLLRGDTLLRKILADSAQGISLLRSHPQIDPGRIGLLGHSYGGNTVLFHAALDDRIAFACASGAACSYRYRMAHEIGIEMSAVVPGLANHFDIVDLVGCMGDRPLLLLSATEDNFSMDADEIVEQAADTVPHLTHLRYEGGHALTQERFDAIVAWVVEQVGPRNDH